MLVYIEFGSSVTVAGDAVADSRGQDPDQIVLPVAGRRKESMYSKGGPYIRKVGRIQLLTRETHFFASTNPRFDRRSIFSACVAFACRAHCLPVGSSTQQRVISRVRGDAARPWEVSPPQQKQQPSYAPHFDEIESGPSQAAAGQYHVAGKRRKSTHASGRPSATSRRRDQPCLREERPHQGARQHRAEKVTVNWEGSCATRTRARTWVRDFVA